MFDYDTRWRDEDGEHYCIYVIYKNNEPWEESEARFDELRECQLAAETRINELKHVDR